MPRRAPFILLLLLLCSPLVQAQFYWYPEDGTWRNPAASGRNYKIDIQDRTLILNLFGYRQNGSAVWYQAAQRRFGTR